MLITRRGNGWNKELSVNNIFEARIVGNPFMKVSGGIRITTNISDSRTQVGDPLRPPRFIELLD